MLLRDLLDDVRSDVQAPDLTLLDAVQKAASEFFHQSGAWVETLDPIELVEGVYEYGLSLPSGARAARLHEGAIKNGSAPMVSVTEREFFTFDLTADGNPGYLALSESTGSAFVWPVPSAAAAGNQVSMRVTIAPNRECDTIPDLLGEKWREGIIAGAKARLMRMPKRDWTDPMLSGVHDAIFWDYVARAKREATSNNYAKPMRVQMRSWV